MTSESSILKIVKEDMLRDLAESKDRLHINSIKSKINVSSFLTFKALKEFEKEGLIKTKKDLISLTVDGQKKSKNILRKYLILENYFKKYPDVDDITAHKKAHTLERYVSEEVIRNIKRMHTLKENAIPSTNFSLRKEGLIADINITKNHNLFERIVSMGIFPGNRIKILAIIPEIFVVKIGNKKFALGFNPDKDFRIEYLSVAHIKRLLLSGQVHAAVLPEPHISQLLFESKGYFHGVFPEKAISDSLKSGRLELDFKVIKQEYLEPFIKALGYPPVNKGIYYDPSLGKFH
jgi:Mn-dependent DtxR family transcriptional regulator